MNLADLAQHHDPLEPYLAFHRRIERHLAALVALAGRLDAGEMDAQAAAEEVALHRAVLRWRSREGLFGGAPGARPRHGIVTPLP